MAQSDIDIYYALKRKGIDPAKASRVQVTAVAVLERSPAQLMKTATEIGGTLTRAARGKTVPLTVLATREAGCNTCSYFRADEYMCLRCGCGGWLLKKRQRDPKRRCPLPKPQRVWDVYNGE